MQTSGTKKPWWYWLLFGILLVVVPVLYQKYPVRQKTDSAQQQSTTVSYQGEDGKNVLELLKAHATVETTTDPNLGEYVTSVNGVKSGTDGKYWIYSVNGLAGSVGAGEQTTVSTDTIEWKLE
jgi:hypothetical protein